MKKIFLGLVALTMGSVMYGQSFGAKAGLNLASVSKVDGGSVKAGFYAGGFANIPVGESFSLQPELFYNNAGYQVNLNNNQKWNYSINYLTLPVMFQYNLVPNFYLEAGPEVGFLLGGKVKYTNGNNTTNIKLSTDNLNNINFGISLGTGVYFTKNLGITARYTAGLTNLNKNSNISSKNNVFQVGVAAKF